MFADKRADGESVYSPPPLTITLPTLPAAQTARPPVPKAPLTIRVPQLTPSSSSSSAPVTTVPYPLGVTSAVTPPSLPPMPTTFPASEPTIIALPPAPPQDAEVAMDTGDNSGGAVSPRGSGRMSRRDSAAAQGGGGPRTPRERESPGAATQKFQCPVCNKTLTGKSSLQTHMNKHTG